LQYGVDFGAGMPSLVRFLTILFWIFSITMLSFFVLATVFEPSQREYNHEILELTLEK